MIKKIIYMLIITSGLIIAFGITLHSVVYSHTEQKELSSSYTSTAAYEPGYPEVFEENDAKNKQDIVEIIKFLASWQSLQLWSGKCQNG